MEELHSIDKMLVLYYLEEKEKHSIWTKCSPEITMNEVTKKKEKLSIILITFLLINYQQNIRYNSRSISLLVTLPRQKH